MDHLRTSLAEMMLFQFRLQKDENIAARRSKYNGAAISAGKRATSATNWRRRVSIRPIMTSEAGDSNYR
jgi:hypothetical protein